MWEPIEGRPQMCPAPGNGSDWQQQQQLQEDAGAGMTPEKAQTSDAGLTCDPWGGAERQSDRGGYENQVAAKSNTGNSSSQQQEYESLVSVVNSHDYAAASVADYGPAYAPAPAQSCGANPFDNGSLYPAAVNIGISSNRSGETDGSRTSAAVTSFGSSSYRWQGAVGTACYDGCATEGDLSQQQQRREQRPLFSNFQSWTSDNALPPPSISAPAPVAGGYHPPALDENSRWLSSFGFVSQWPTAGEDFASIGDSTWLAGDKPPTRYLEITGGQATDDFAGSEAAEMASRDSSEQVSDFQQSSLKSGGEEQSKTDNAGQSAEQCEFFGSINEDGENPASSSLAGGGSAYESPSTTEGDPTTRSPVPPINVRIQTITNYHIQYGPPFPMLSSNWLFPAGAGSGQARYPTAEYPTENLPNPQVPVTTENVAAPGTQQNAEGQSANHFSPAPTPAVKHELPASNIYGPSAENFDFAGPGSMKQAETPVVQQQQSSFPTKFNSPKQQPIETSYYSVTDSEENAIHGSQANQFRKPGVFSAAASANASRPANNSFCPDSDWSTACGRKYEPNGNGQYPGSEVVSGDRATPGPSGPWPTGTGMPRQQPALPYCPNGANMVHPAPQLAMIQYHHHHHHHPASWFHADAYSRRQAGLHFDNLVSNLGDPVPDTKHLATSLVPVVPEKSELKKSTRRNGSSSSSSCRKRYSERKGQDEKKFKCTYGNQDSVCNKRFAKEQELQVHINKQHLKIVKPYFCDAESCGKSFKRPDQLKRHQKIHTGEKPHKCDLCGRRFARTDHCKTHKSKHSGEKPFVCRQVGCNRKFARNDELRRHEASKHMQHHHQQQQQQQQQQHLSNSDLIEAEQRREIFHQSFGNLGLQTPHTMPVPVHNTWEFTEASRLPGQ